MRLRWCVLSGSLKEPDGGDRNGGGKGRGARLANSATPVSKRNGSRGSAAAASSASDGANDTVLASLWVRAWARAAAALHDEKKGAAGGGLCGGGSGGGGAAGCGREKSGFSAVRKVWCWVTVGERGAQRCHAVRLWSCDRACRIGVCVGVEARGDEQGNLLIPVTWRET